MDENGKFEILFEAIKSDYDTITNADNALDQKSGVLLAFEIALVVGYFSFVITKSFSAFSFCEWLFGLIAFVLIIISLILLLIINWPKTYASIMVDLSRHKEYLNITKEKLTLQLVSDAQGALNKNKQKLRTKTLLYKIAVSLLIGSAFFVILSLITIFYV